MLPKRSACLSTLSVFVRLTFVKIGLKSTTEKHPTAEGDYPPPPPNLPGGESGLGRRTPLVTRQGHTLYALHPQILAGKWGVEPHTSSLTMRHSADELPTRNPTALTGGRGEIKINSTFYEKSIGRFTDKGLPTFKTSLQSDRPCHAWV